ncbi:hypothetical protein ACO22_04543 [Paracoccidioides brasiliensis]|uniref:Uncharacterized protein n=1 Tax=Paracoccidioides brasiliensis TaxID=121759 RepID=A0A1D2JCW2_PARBR|nr:hypothetical protein ACO22_04543 [Paracoccidioides brasiliensis]
MPAGQPSINKDHLESNGITYDEFVLTHGDGGHAGSTLPTHVASFSQIVLDFSALVTDQNRNRFEQAAQTYLASDRDRNDNNSFRPPESAYINDFDTPSVLAEDLQLQMKHGVDVAKKIQHGAKSALQISNGNSFCRRYSDVMRILTHLRNGTGIFLTNFLCRQKNILCDDTENRVDNRLAKLPKPDFTYGYTIYEDIPSALQSTELVTNFSLQSLGELRSAGLISSPFVVELHPFEVSRQYLKQFTYCQTANAALAALRMYEDPSKRSTGRYDFVPPVVVFTCIGAEIKVWLAYSEIEHDVPVDHKMACIWSSSLCLEWGVMATCRIVQNMIFWASRVWKPQISGCISQIRLNKRLASPDGKATQRALPMIFHPLGPPKQFIFDKNIKNSNSPFVFSANPTRPKLPPRSTIKNSSRSKPGIQPPSALQQASQDHPSKAKQQNGVLRSSHLGPVIDTEIRKEVEHGYMAETDLTLKRIDNWIKSLNLTQGIDDHGTGNRATENEEEPLTGGLIILEVAEGKQDADQAEDCKAFGQFQEFNFSRPPSRTSQMNSSSRMDSAKPSWAVWGSVSDDSVCQGRETFKPGDVNCWRLDEDTGVDKCHTRSSVPGTEIISSCSRPLKWEEYEEWKGSPREVSENKNAQSCCEDRKDDFWDVSNQQANPTTGECLHCRTKLVEELELLWGVLELWVSQSDSVPSVPGLEKILQELNSVLEPHDTIQPEQMWATEVGTWETIDQALQILHQSDNTKLRNLLVWTIECVDLVDIVDLFDILKFGKLSCAQLKCMKQEAKSIMDLSQD